MQFLTKNDPPSLGVREKCYLVVTRTCPRLSQLTREFLSLFTTFLPTRSIDYVHFRYSHRGLECRSTLSFLTFVLPVPIRRGRHLPAHISDTTSVNRLSHQSVIGLVTAPSKLLVDLYSLLWYQCPRQYGTTAGQPIRRRQRASGSQETIVESTINLGGYHGNCHRLWRLSLGVCGVRGSDFVVSI